MKTDAFLKRAVEILTRRGESDIQAFFDLGDCISHELSSGSYKTIGKAGQHLATHLPERGYKVPMQEILAAHFAASLPDEIRTGLIKNACPVKIAIRFVRQDRPTINRWIQYVSSGSHTWLDWSNSLASQQHQARTQGHRITKRRHYCAVRLDTSMPADLVENKLAAFFAVKGSAFFESVVAAVRPRVKNIEPAKRFELSA